MIVHLQSNVNVTVFWKMDYYNMSLNLDNHALRNLVESQRYELQQLKSELEAKKTQNNQLLRTLQRKKLANNIAEAIKQDTVPMSRVFSKWGIETSEEITNFQECMTYLYKDHVESPTKMKDWLTLLQDCPDSIYERIAKCLVMMSMSMSETNKDE